MCLLINHFKNKKSATPATRFEPIFGKDFNLKSYLDMIEVESVNYEQLVLENI